MPAIPALIVRVDDIKQDLALQPKARGARKIGVTEIYRDKECSASQKVWKPPTSPIQKCPVLVMEDTEIAVFNQNAKQDRHCHKHATEIYMVLNGTMSIEIEGNDYRLDSGDMIIVNHKSFHKVKPDKSTFLCRVITVNCQGEKDRIIA